MDKAQLSRYGLCIRFYVNNTRIYCKNVVLYDVIYSTRVILHPLCKMEFLSTGENTGHYCPVCKNLPCYMKLVDKWP